MLLLQTIILMPRQKLGLINFARVDQLTVKMNDPQTIRPPSSQSIHLKKMNSPRFKTKRLTFLTLSHLIVNLCSLQVVYDNVYMLDDDMKWKVLPPMPKPDSHIEFAWAIVNNSIVIVGGTTEKHPVTKRMILVGEVFRFDFNTLVFFEIIRTYF